jgi:hypothetical protein
MPRHANYVPKGVIPAVLLPFENDLSIDEAFNCVICFTLAFTSCGLASLYAAHIWI